MLVLAQVGQVQPGAAPKRAVVALQQAVQPAQHRPLQALQHLVGDVLRHRLVLSYEALADGLTADQIVQKVMKKIAVPDKPLAPEAKGG